MATGSILIDEGSTTRLATHTLTEDVQTKHIGRSNLNKSDGTELIGQKAMATSIPVALASDQPAIPVSAASLPLPSGAATAANQTTIAGHVDGIEGLLTTPSALVAFVTAVTTAGTRVQLAANAIAAGVLQAPSTNTGIIYVGGATVSATVFGAELQPGQSTGIAINNTDKIYIDASVNGDKCAFIGS